MKKLKKMFTSPFVHIVILYIIEIAITIFMISYLNDALIMRHEGFKITSYILKIFTFLMFLSVVFYKNMDYAYRVNWILLFLISPTFGGLIYALTSRRRPLPKKWQKFYKYRKQYNSIGKTDHPLPLGFSSLDDGLKKTALYLENTASSPLCDNTNSRFLYKGEKAWDEIKKDLKNAKSYIYLEFYIIAKGQLWNEIKDILIEKQKSGVEVRVLFDDMGSISKIDKKMLRTLSENNIRWARFNPVKLHLDSSLNFRNHRKIVVIDGNISYTGGINLADEYINVNSPFGVWFDTGIRLEGEASRSLLSTFLKDWWFATGEKVDVPPSLKNECEGSGLVQFYPDSPFDSVPIARNTFLSMLSNSKKYMYIATPYLALDDESINALIMSANSGVDIRIVVPGIPDKKIVFTITESHFEKLIKNGIKIYKYTPGFLHAKVLLSDSNIASVGSVNIDYRSFYLNFECGVALYESNSIKDIEHSFEELFKESECLTSYKETKWFKIKHFAVKFLTPFF